MSAGNGATSIPKFIQTFGQSLKDASQSSPAKHFSLIGRIRSKRELGKALSFFTIQSDGAQVQVVTRSQDFSSAAAYQALGERLRVGDVALFSGTPGLSQRGELSLFAREGRLLAVSKSQIPFKHEIKHENKIRRDRVLEMMISPVLMKRIITRRKVVDAMRGYLNSKGFLEVDTPILSSHSGGANAKPFLTRCGALNRDLFLRIAPELYLKQMIVGGFSRIYEIGKVFRNEGLDSSHHPEFLSCEFYEVGQTLSGLMQTTQDLLEHVCGTITGGTCVKVPWSTDKGGEVNVDLGGGFKVVDVFDYIQGEFGVKLPDPQGLESADSVPHLLEIMDALGLEYPGRPYTPSRCFNYLVTQLVEPSCLYPTFLVGFPTVCSPLAKESSTRRGVARRTELIIGGREIVNAYEELNDASEQRKRFQMQQQARRLGESEAHEMDEAYCRVLEYGMPPTAGWGIGVDRLVMLLSGAHDIRDAMPFTI